MRLVANQFLRIRADPPSLDNFYDEFYSITMDEENNVREKGKEIDRGGIIRGTAVNPY